MFFKPVSEVTTAVEKEYHHVSEIVYPQLQKVVFDTDIFMPYGSQSFIGVFPFCSKENQHFIDDKFDRVFEDLQIENPIMASYGILNTFVTFPIDGENRDLIMKELIRRLYEGIDAQKIILQDNEFDNTPLLGT